MKVQHLGGLGFKDGAEAGIYEISPFWTGLTTNFDFWAALMSRIKKSIPLNIAGWPGFNKN